MRDQHIDGGRLARRAMLAALFVVALLGAVTSMPASASAAPSFGVQVLRNPSTPNRLDERITYTVKVTNTSATDTINPAPGSSPTAVSMSFPQGMKLGTGSIVQGGGGSIAGLWNCRYTASTCVNETSVPPGGSFPDLVVEVWSDPDVTPDDVTATLTIYGGGAPDKVVQDGFAFAPAASFGLTSFVAAAKDAAGVDYTQAGGHPFRGTTSFEFSTYRTLRHTDGTDRSPVDNARDAIVNLPPGFVGNPEALPEGGCTAGQVAIDTCDAKFAVGLADITLVGATLGPRPVYKLRRDRGTPAAFAVKPVLVTPVVIALRAKVRNDDYGITAFSPVPPESPALLKVTEFTFCSYGAGVLDVGFLLSTGCKQPTDPGALTKPFLTNPTRCDGAPPETSIDLSSFQDPGTKDEDGFPDLSDPNWKSYSSVSPQTTGCDQVPFAPALSVAATTTAPDSPSGLDFELDLPQDGLVDPNGIATSHLRTTVVQLPEGMAVNPSGATGLAGCSDEQVRFGIAGKPQCPDGSKIGAVDVTSPVLEQSLSGDMYLATPKSTDPMSGEMLRLFLVIRSDELGILVKVRGSAVADPETGQLTATFDNNPQLPFSHLEVHLKDGERGVLATPQDCGTKTIQSTLTPWSGTAPVDQNSDTDITGDCGEKFAPKLEAGSSDNAGRGKGGVYSFKFSREDGEQWLRGLTAKLPQGLLASVKDVPLCSNAAADAGSCPADSKIGVVDAKAGAGDPFVLEEKGEVFLTEGYKGGEYGLAVKIRPVAGPFRGDMELSPIIVRQAIHVDRSTAQVTAISDPFPLIHHGIPLRAREVNVLVNRGGFMLNPSDCTQKQTAASLLSAEGATSDQTDPFQVSGCANLPFKPKLALALTGRKQVTTGKHPGIKATVTQQGASEAGIEKAVVRLPKSLALDPENAQALCEFADGTKPDLENHCPKGSIVGRARAKTPLLRDDLVGNVYFVKNIRIDPTTGNEIRTLPMIVVALRGEIAINLRGESSTTNSGKLVNTFASVPDAPINQFNLNIQGGKTGIIAVTRTRKAKINLCTGRHIAETDMDGQNGRRHDFDVRMKTPCTKKQTKAAKLRARRAAAKAKR